MKTIKKVAVSPIPEINGSVVDTFNVEDKTTNAPSVNAVENYIKAQNTYSTEETFTGKYWIDGKKIYSRVFKNTSFTFNTAGAEIGSISNIDELVFHHITIRKEDGPFRRSGYISGNYYAGIQIDGAGIITIWGKDGNNVTGTVVLTVEYTKTTDV